MYQLAFDETSFQWLRNWLGCFFFSLFIMRPLKRRSLVDTSSRSWLIICSGQGLLCKVWNCVKHLLYCILPSILIKRQVRSDRLFRSYTLCASWHLKNKVQCNITERASQCVITLFVSLLIADLLKDVPVSVAPDETGLQHAERPSHITHPASLQLHLSVHIPSGLVGEPTMGNVIIQDKPANAIMDIVSIVSEGWYSQHLSHLSLHPILSLDMWALGQTSYQYTWRCSCPQCGDQWAAKPLLALVCL